MWNAFYVQNTVQLNLTGVVGWPEVRNSAKEIFLRPCEKQLIHLNQVVTSLDRLRQQCSERQTRNQLFDKPVLGLAGCHWQKWKLVQVHGGDQSPLPPLWNSFVGTGIHNGPVPPAICNLVQTKTRKISQKDVLHLFRWFTHTHSRRRVEN